MNATKPRARGQLWLREQDVEAVELRKRDIMLRTTGTATTENASVLDYPVVPIPNDPTMFRLDKSRLPNAPVSFSFTTFTVYP